MYMLLNANRIHANQEAFELNSDANLWDLIDTNFSLIPKLVIGN